MGTISNHAIQSFVLTNDERIDRIDFDVPMYGYCPLGADTYTALAHVEITLADFYPEYTTMFKYIEGMQASFMHANPHTLEQNVFEIGTFLLDVYQPATVTITAYMETVDGKDVEYPVHVTKVFKTD